MKLDILQILVASVIGQIVVGTVFLIGFIQIVRKSIDKDIPARLGSIDVHIKDLARELLEMRRTLDKHEYKIESLESAESRRQDRETRRAGDNPDDTGIRRRR